MSTRKAGVGYPFLNTNKFVPPCGEDEEERIYERRKKWDQGRVTRLQVDFRPESVDITICDENDPEDREYHALLAECRRRGLPGAVIAMSGGHYKIRTFGELRELLKEGK